MNTSIENSIIENLVSVQPLLSKTFSKQMRTTTNLNPGSLYVLGLISHYEKLSMSEIGLKLSMPKPHVTSHVDRLIADKLVKRTTTVHDRRIINIEITPKGKKRFDEIRWMISKELREKLELLTENEQQNLLDATKTLRQLLNKILMTETTNK
jgi:DNA-binding MarR family transcriptional regulator